ncbi:ABC transporter permease [Xenorhabdus szentirmaii]|uniref:ABC transmembrane type-2 domain-containing protein n=2 Tax=Xenorhabdus szentirmaii TaxID=290112 RepID=W1J526_9GAMM|nr:MULTISPECIES: ABC transporter permease [Xenorhabdus]MBD2792274.1 ABC transporter permease [Xenorhabdus sp. CUL]MBD2800912.1 ABC transporter permease [Xenorhabdus sp. M]MBD2819271.1 ABC transporter permease [Xenorhabdus sp. 42]MBD2823745.1 ABC transporter permease [Xenorhabdus sp. 5]PHM32982.1 ABC transporter [Xenorhabdus szentirmaii DSM 16338]
MNSSLINLMTTQFRQYLREPEILFWSFGFPLLLVWLLGLSFSSQSVPERDVGIVLPTGITEQQKIKAWGEALVAQEHVISGIVNQKEIKRDNLVKVKYRIKYYPDRDAVVLGLKRGDIQMFIEQNGEGQRIYSIDPQNSDALLTYYLLNQQKTEQADNALFILETPGLRYLDFLIPGLLAMAIMETCLIAVGWALAEKRITQVTRQMCITPMKKSLFLMAHILACFIINFVEILIIYWFAEIYFDIEMQGSFYAFLLLLFAGNICFSGMAVLVASRARKGQTANGLLEVTILIQVLLSGIFFSYKKFPEWMANIVEYLPLTILADNMRKIFIEGGDVMQVIPAVIILSLFGVVIFIAGMKIFRWY